MRPLVYRQLVILLLVGVSLASTIGLFRLTLELTASQFASDFVRQNHNHFANSNSMAIVQALQGLSAERQWQCVVARRSGAGEFFRQTGSDCSEGWLSRRVVAEDKGISDISVDFVVRLPPIQEWLFGAFVFLQLALAGLLTRAVRRVEALRVQHEIEVASIAKRVSHDIRTPLSTLRLAIGTFRELDPERQALVDSALGQISAIAEDLLKKARLPVVKEENLPNTQTGGAGAERNARRESLSTAATSLEQVKTMLEEVISLKRLASSDIRLRLEVDIAEGSRLSEVPVSASELRRLVENLVHNSAEAIVERLKTEPAALAFISISASTERSHDGLSIFELIVRDSGLGVPPAIRARLFERGATFGKPNGNGIALAEGKALVERVGGSIQLLTSEPGRGAAFRIELPIHSPEP